MILKVLLEFFMEKYNKIALIERKKNNISEIGRQLEMQITEILFIMEIH